MIKNKNDLREYLEQDRRALEREGKRPKFHDLIWKFEIELRYCEYYRNCRKDILGKIAYAYHKYRKYQLGLKCNFAIHENTVGKGLAIAHVGPIITNQNVRIGENCRIHVGVNIGTAAGQLGAAPRIGNDVYIGPGAKIFGPIEIPDGVAIGANAVVNKTVERPNVTVVGVPAKIVSEKGSGGYICK